MSECESVERGRRGEINKTMVAPRRGGGVHDENTPLARAEAGRATSTPPTIGFDAAREGEQGGEGSGGVGNSFFFRPAAITVFLLLTLVVGAALVVVVGGEGGGRMQTWSSSRLGVSGMIMTTRVSAHANLGQDGEGDEGSPMMDKVNLCPQAFTEPAKRSGVKKTKYSAVLSGVINYADRVYVLCSAECDTLVIPEDWNEVTLVNGPVLDECNGMGEVVHWVKASRMHEAAIEHAFDDREDVNVVAVLEEDTVGDKSVDWVGREPWYAFEAAFHREEWNAIRMSYRPYDFEPGRDASLGDPEATCPNECQCHMYGDKLCFTHGSGCALQAADAYLMHRRAYNQTTSALRRGQVVDYHVFKQLEGQFLFKPPLSYQSRYSYAPDEIDIETSVDVAKVYMEKCSYQADDQWGR